MSIVLQHDDYRDVLRSALLEKKEKVSKRFTFQRMAEACHVQKSYLSKALKCEGHLSPDQVFLACEFLALAPAETEIIVLMNERERSAYYKRKEHLEGEINNKRKQLQKTERHLILEAQETYTDRAREFFLDPEAQLVHLFLHLEAFTRQPDLIAKKLGLTKDQLVKILQKLARLQLIVMNDDGYEIKEHTLHLSRDSDFFPSYRRLMRAKLMERLGRLNPPRDYGFSVFFSADGPAFDRIQERFLAFLKEAQEIADQSTHDDVFQMSFDLLSWGN